MKKLFMILFAVFVAFAANSQTIGTPIAFGKDSTTDVQVKYLDLDAPVAINNNYTVGVTITPTNKSGTATVVAALQFSNNNSVWHDYGTSTTVNTAGTVGNWSWILPDLPFKYVRVKCTSSGSGVTVLNGTMIIKRK
jgi:hypothetical protein